MYLLNNALRMRRTKLRATPGRPPLTRPLRYLCAFTNKILRKTGLPACPQFPLPWPPTLPSPCVRRVRRVCVARMYSGYCIDHQSYSIAPSGIGGDRAVDELTALGSGVCNP